MISAALQEHIRASYRFRKVKDFFACNLLKVASLLAIVPLFLVLGYTIQRGLPALNPSFFLELPKPVGEPGGGMANAVLGTLTLICLASILGVGWGLMIGIYLSEYGKGKLGSAVRFSADMLASVPSIVIGLLVYVVVVIPMGRFSAIAGGIALGIIMIPTVARSTEELLRLVPTHIREAGLALGLPRWKVILRIVLRGCASGITTGVMLAIARVAGETAPLLFTALNNRFWTVKLDQPIASIPVQIYTYAISPFDEWHKQAWAGAFVLVLMVFGINIMSRVLLRRDAGGRE